MKMYKQLMIHLVTLLITSSIGLPLPVENTDNDKINSVHSIVENDDKLIYKQDPNILEFENKHSDTEHYSNYRLADGQWRNDTIQILNPGTEIEEIIHKGSYGFKGSDGFDYMITYYADKNGYHANVERFEPLKVLFVPANVLKSLVG